MNTEIKSGYKAIMLCGQGAKMEACPYEDKSNDSETWFEGYTWAIEEKYDGGREPQ